MGEDSDAFPAQHFPEFLVSFMPWKFEVLGDDVGVHPRVTEPIVPRHPL